MEIQTPAMPVRWMHTCLFLWFFLSHSIPVLVYPSYSGLELMGLKAHEQLECMTLSKNDVNVITSACVTAVFVLYVPNVKKEKRKVRDSMNFTLYTETLNVSNSCKDWILLAWACRSVALYARFVFVYECSEVTVKRQPLLYLEEDSFFLLPSSVWVKQFVY